MEETKNDLLFVKGSLCSLNLSPYLFLSLSLSLSLSLAIYREKVLEFTAAQDLQA